MAQPRITWSKEELLRWRTLDVYPLLPAITCLSRQEAKAPWPLTESRLQSWCAWLEENGCCIEAQENKSDTPVPLLKARGTISYGGNGKAGHPAYARLNLHAGDTDIDQIEELILAHPLTRQGTTRRQTKALGGHLSDFNVLFKTINNVALSIGYSKEGDPTRNGVQLSHAWVMFDPTDEARQIAVDVLLNACRYSNMCHRFTIDGWESVD